MANDNRSQSAPNIHSVIHLAGCVIEDEKGGRQYCWRCGMSLIDNSREQHLVDRGWKTLYFPEGEMVTETTAGLSAIQPFLRQECDRDCLPMTQERNPCL